MNNKTRHPFYGTAEWQKVRAKALVRDGYKCVSCGDCVRGKGLSRVDHIKTRKERPDLALDLSNLRTLCIKCDANRHREKGGGEQRKPTGEDGYPAGW